MTSLQFTGRAVKVVVNVPKDSSNNYGARTEDAGSIDVTFRIEAPKRPKDPSKNRYDYKSPRLREQCKGERPAGKKEGAAWDKAKAELDAIQAGFQREDADYQVALRAVAAATMAYAQLAGICAVFANQRLSVILRPAEQDLLPGMGINVLLVDSQLALAAPADDDDADHEIGWDEEDGPDDEAADGDGSAWPEAAEMSAAEPVEA